MTRRAAWIAIGLVVALAVANFLVYRYEAILNGGARVLLELAPVDPRSLMQGDYMRLHFALAGEIERLRETQAANRAHRYAVLHLDTAGVGHLRRIQADPIPLESDAVVLRFEVRKGAVRLVSEAYFLEEGRSEHFARAKFAEIRVDPKGNALLSSLRDANRSRL